MSPLPAGAKSGDAGPLLPQIAARCGGRHLLVRARIGASGNSLTRRAAIIGVEGSANLHSIPQEYANARALNEALTGSAYFSNRYKDHREWHILGAAHDAHTRVQRPFPTHAIKRQSPDFELFNTPSHAAYPLEVTMVIPPDYKLHRHYKEWEAAGSTPQDHPYPGYRDHWDWLRARIDEKLQEPYAKGCALLVYFDVSLHDTVERNPDDFASAITGEWHRHPQGDFGLSTIRASGIRNVMVMSADTRALIEIYPRLDVVAT